MTDVVMDPATTDDLLVVDALLERIRLLEEMTQVQDSVTAFLLEQLKVVTSD